ncbi:MAG TPA: hypothetical protein VJA94_09250 [Candidatus Angelobacter sp.]
MSYLASAPVKTGWKMQPSQFASSLIQDWPAAKIRDHTFAFPFALDWEIEMPGGLLLGDFSDDPLGISVDGAFDDCAAFAVWFRSLVPPQQPLLFYDQGFNVDVPLTSKTTVEDLRAAFDE